MEAVKETIVILKREVRNTSGGASTFKPKVLEPKSFNGERNSKELENFLLDIKQYFSVIKIGVAEQVNLIVIYLMGDAKLWWRMRNKEDLSVRRPEIKTRDHLK